MSKQTDVSVRQVGPKGAKKAIRKAIKVRRPVFLWGPPGIGKSDIVKQIGEDADREVIDVRLALWEPTDIKVIRCGRDCRKGSFDTTIHHCVG